MKRELMENKNGIESALANLIQLSSEKGFLVYIGQIVIKI